MDDTTANEINDNNEENNEKTVEINNNEENKKDTENIDSDEFNKKIDINDSSNTDNINTEVTSQLNTEDINKINSEEEEKNYSISVEITNKTDEEIESIY